MDKYNAIIVKKRGENRRLEISGKTNQVSLRIWGDGDNGYFWQGGENVVTPMSLRKIFFEGPLSFHEKNVKRFG